MVLRSAVNVITGYLALSWNALQGVYGIRRAAVGMGIPMDMGIVVNPHTGFWDSVGIYEQLWDLVETL